MRAMLATLTLAVSDSDATYDSDESRCVSAIVITSAFVYGFVFAEDDRPGRDADPNPEAFGAPAAPHLECVLLHLADDAECTAHGPLGVVLPRRRCAEEGKDAVTGEVLDVTAERLHLAHDPCHRLAHDELHVLRVEPFRERCRADHVGEDGRQNLPLLADRSTHAQRKADADVAFKSAGPRAR